MKIALLGVDDDTPSLVAAAVAAGHQVTAIDQQFEEQGNWQPLLVDGNADAVIVARASPGREDARTEQLRVLIQSELPLLVAHPVMNSMLVYYELDMIRQDSGCRIVPYVAARWHPAVERLAEIVTEGENSPIGPIQQLVVERAVDSQRKADIVAAFIRDVSVMRAIVGDLNKLGAMTPGGTNNEADLASLSVQMSGAPGILARWSIGSLSGSSGRMTLIGRRGAVTLPMNDRMDAWKLELRSGDRVTEETFENFDPAAEGIDELLAARAGQTTSPTWLDACRDMELADAIERSLARGRTIDLHFEEQTEDSTFKGMMAAGGCLVLVLVLGVLILATIVGGGPRFSFWPIVLLVVLVGFLGLQLLRLAFPVKGPR
jgi:myo-inositol 2-dehydrogenase/D-chiro-inositol 1-dehydrogenase